MPVATPPGLSSIGAATPGSAQDYEVRQVAPSRVATPQTFADALRDEVAKNKQARVVVLGETHGPLANGIFDKSVAEVKRAAAANGEHLVAAVETPTTPEVDKLLDQYDKHQITREQFLDRASPLLAAPLGNGRSAEPWLVEKKRQALEQDVTSKVEQGVPVVFWDRNRRNASPGTRDETGAKVIENIVNSDPRALVLVQAGLVHAQKNGTLRLDPYRRTLDKVDEQNPLAKRLATDLGQAAVVSVAEDPLVTKDGKTYTNTIPNGLAEAKPGRQTVTVGGPNPTYDFVVPVSPTPLPKDARIEMLPPAP